MCIRDSFATHRCLAAGSYGYHIFSELGTYGVLGKSDQTVLEEYLIEALDGIITAEQYPVIGDGRINTVLLDDGQFTDDRPTKASSRSESHTSSTMVSTSLQAFPNPNSTGNFTLQTTDFMGEVATVKVSNISGQLVQEINLGMISQPTQLVSIPAEIGMYFIEVVTPQQRSMVKVIIR